MRFPRLRSECLAESAPKSGSTNQLNTERWRSGCMHFGSHSTGAFTYSAAAPDGSLSASQIHHGETLKNGMAIATARIAAA